jgi:hypothetical protein
MNVDDVKELETIEGDALEAIFARQTELMIKYVGIDDAFKPLLARLAVGLHGKDMVDVKLWPVNVDDYVAQVLLKEFAWRVAEELTESTQALRDHGEIVQHAKEELADALHFLVELAILVGVVPADLVIPGRKPPFDHLHALMDESLTLERTSPEGDAYGVVQDIGNAMNCLKNKPWKKSQVLTDVPKFKGYVVRSFLRLARYAWTIGMDADDVLAFYFKKSLVNKFRQRSGY